MTGARLQWQTIDRTRDNFDGKLDLERFQLGQDTSLQIFGLWL